MPIERAGITQISQAELEANRKEGMRDILAFLWENRGKCYAIEEIGAKTGRSALTLLLRLKDAPVDYLSGIFANISGPIRSITWHNGWKLRTYYGFPTLDGEMEIVDEMPEWNSRAANSFASMSEPTD